MNTRIIGVKAIENGSFYFGSTVYRLTLSCGHSPTVKSRPIGNKHRCDICNNMKRRRK